MLIMWILDQLHIFGFSLADSVLKSLPYLFDVSNSLYAKLPLDIYFKYQSFWQEVSLPPKKKKKELYVTELFLQ